MPETLDKIKIKAEKDDFIIKMKVQVKLKEKNKTFSAFSICDGVLMYANRIVMPLSFQKKILKEFHLGHARILCMKSLMRSYTYWPWIDHDIEKIVKTYIGCCAFATKYPPVNFQLWPKTTHRLCGTIKQVLSSSSCGQLH